MGRELFLAWRGAGAGAALDILHQIPQYAFGICIIPWYRRISHLQVASVVTNHSGRSKLCTEVQLRHARVYHGYAH